MVTQSATVLERHLLMAGEPPPLHREFLGAKRRILSKEDPMSHRIIEKRRRDRMNNCLADLSRLIPADYVKKGRGRIEKTEIIEMAIKHMKYLQSHACNQIDEFDTVSAAPTKSGPIVAEHYRLGYHECLSETMHFLVEVEGYFAGDSLCIQLISHLQKHCDKILKGDGLNMPRTHLGDTTSGSSNGSFGGDKGGGEGSGASSDGGERRGGEEVDFEMRGSQLRDILTYPNNRLQLLPESPAPSPLSVEHDRHEQHLSSSNSLYKFKNNIKQRFNSEHPKNTGPVKCEVLKRRYSDAPPPVPSPTPTPPPTPSVPIFALHTNGAYYVPLTVTQAALEPFLGELSLFLRPGDTAVSLHPVTISVNFSPLTMVVTRQASSPFSQPPLHWHTAASLPKWTTCNPD